MAGHRRAERHFRRFLVAHFADQNDVRVLPHHRTDTVGEVHAHGVVHRCLPHQRQRILDRVFQRHDVDCFVVDLREQRIKCGGFAGTGRAGHDQNALGVGDDMRKIDRFLTDRARHDVADRGFGDEAQAHQLAADRNVVLFLLGERDAELIGRDQPLLYQQFTQSQLFALFCHDVILPLPARDAVGNAGRSVRCAPRHRRASGRLFRVCRCVLRRWSR